MVQIALPNLAVAALGLSPLVVATPAAAVKFTVSQWVEDLISSPATALSVEEAIAAHLNATSTAIKPRNNDKRQSCHATAPVAAAISCINWLASQGQSSLQVGGNWEALCVYNYADLYARSLVGLSQSAANDYARGYGYIMDKCTQGGYTGGYHTPHGNGDISIQLA